jgi:hypothetical protein
MGILNGLFKSNCNGNVAGETTDNGDSLLFFFLLLVILFCNCGLFEDDSSLLFFFLLLVILFCNGCGSAACTTCLRVRRCCDERDSDVVPML